MLTNRGTRTCELRGFPAGDTASLYVARATTGRAATRPGDQLAVQTPTGA